MASPDDGQDGAVLGPDKAKPLARRPVGPALSAPARGADGKAGRDGEVVPAVEQRGKEMMLLNRARQSSADSAG